MVPTRKIYCKLIKKGQLIYLPPGYAHAVYTLEKSIVIGGNLLHLSSIKDVCLEFNRDMAFVHQNPCKREVCRCKPGASIDRLPELVYWLGCLIERGQVSADDYQKQQMS